MKWLHYLKVRNISNRFSSFQCLSLSSFVTFLRSWTKLQLGFSTIFFLLWQVYRFVWTRGFCYLAFYCLFLIIFSYCNFEWLYRWEFGMKHIHLIKHHLFNILDLSLWRQNSINFSNQIAPLLNFMSHKGLLFIFDNSPKISLDLN